MPDFTSACGGIPDMAGIGAGLVPVENDPYLPSTVSISPAVGRRSGDVLQCSQERRIGCMTTFLSIEPFKYCALVESKTGEPEANAGSKYAKPINYASTKINRRGFGEISRRTGNFTDPESFIDCL
jgi:hypothetical protein